MTNSTHPPQKSKSLVLVVGAGASKEVGLPIGDELKTSIAKALDFKVVRGGYEVTGGDHRIIECFYQLVQSTDGRQGDINALLRAARLIRDAMPQAPSIDNFIDSHRGDDEVAKCGKLAIAACILKAEEASKLRVDRSNIYNTLDFSSASHTWFNGLFQLLSQNCHRDDLLTKFQRVAIVCFNYDRCIEHYLHSSLQNYYKVTAEEATELMKHLDVYHPYGSVGPLPWMNSPRAIDFGGQPHSRELLALALRLRTFTEGTDAESSDVGAIRAAMHSAERTVFVGFAFHTLNLELLYGPPGTPIQDRPHVAYGTALGLSESNAMLIQQEVAAMAGLRDGNITLRRDLTSAKLFNDYSRALTLRG